MWYITYISLTNHTITKMTNNITYKIIYIKLPMLILVNIKSSLLL